MKKAIRKERNRLSAKKSRDRKEQCIRELEERLQAALERISQLESELLQASMNGFAVEQLEDPMPSCDQMLSCDNLADE